VKITVDTNILLRVATEDDPRQAKLARTVLESADLVAVTLPVLCEFVWVLLHGYKLPRRDIADAMRRLIDAENVVLNRPAAEAGLVVLEAGGDFADGVIAYEGRLLGAESFISFDDIAVKRLSTAGESARLIK
jgi:predicted nucleic-acid-binding protein